MATYILWLLDEEVEGSEEEEEGGGREEERRALKCSILWADQFGIFRDGIRRKEK